MCIIPKNLQLKQNLSLEEKINIIISLVYNDIEKLIIKDDYNIILTKIKEAALNTGRAGVRKARLHQALNDNNYQLAAKEAISIAKSWHMELREKRSIINIINHKYNNCTYCEGQLIDLFIRGKQEKLSERILRFIDIYNQCWFEKSFDDWQELADLISIPWHFIEKFSNNPHKDKKTYNISINDKSNQLKWEF